MKKKLQDTNPGIGNPRFCFLKIYSGILEKIVSLKSFAILFILSFPIITSAQVGIGTTDPKAQLDILATNSSNPTNTDGILIPRINVFPIINPTADQQGLMVFLMATSGTKGPGFYYWDFPTRTWIGVGSNTSGGWTLTGNKGGYTAQHEHTILITNGRPVILTAQNGIWD